MKNRTGRARAARIFQIALEPLIFPALNLFKCHSLSSPKYLLFGRSRTDVLANLHRRYFSRLSSDNDHDRLDASRFRSCAIFSTLENNELL